MRLPEYDHDGWEVWLNDHRDGRFCVTRHNENGWEFLVYSEDCWKKDFELLDEVLNTRERVLESLYRVVVGDHPDWDDHTP